MDACYVPNNPSLCGGGLAELACSVPSAGYWGADDMGSFSLPLDLDPLPSLFPFSPCPASCKQGDFASTGKEKQPHDVADVLLSLKHAVVHPGQLSPPLFPGYAPAGQTCGQGAYQGPSASLSYTVHPHQMVSPGGGYGPQYCGGVAAPQDQGSMYPGAQPQHNVFPSMSVNVSMNMTMHGYPPAMDNLQHQVSCPQVQWSSAPPSASPVYPQPPQALLSPQQYPAGAANFSFTADFRPSQPVVDTALLGPHSPFKTLVASKPPAPRHAAPARRTAPATASYQTKAMSEESQRPNLCRICGKTYARPSTLKTHLRTHSGEKPYRCGDCNKSFSQAANLTAHVRTHSGEKPFRCPICDRRFSQSSSVTTHMRTHSGERPYRCRLCKKAFSDSSTLTKHLRIHSGEKPYQCKLCLLRFSQSGNLNRHMRVHGGGGGALGCLPA